MCLDSSAKLTGTFIVLRVGHTENPHSLTEIVAPTLAGSLHWPCQERERNHYVFIAIRGNLKILGHLVKYIHFAIRQLSSTDSCAVGVGPGAGVCSKFAV